MTKPYAEVIGDPISQSRSPLIHKFWLEKLGIDADFRACHVRAEELGDYFARRRGDAAWRGCNITIPHKLAALAFVDQVDPGARDVGASNCVVHQDGELRAFNTDTDGVLAAIPNADWPICMIGAGGAARAVMPIASLYKSGFSLNIVARDVAKAQQSLDPDNNDQIKFFEFEKAADALKDVEGIINASPLSMIGQPEMPASILDNLHLASDTAYVFDMVYAPLETPLLRAARAQGLAAIDGLHMLIGQAAVAFEHFFGQPAPRQHDAELRALLAQ